MRRGFATAAVRLPTVGQKLCKRVVSGLEAGRGGGVVFLDVNGEMIAASEALLAVRTVKRAFSRVFATMSSQLVGPREPPRASRPVTDVRLLAGVLADVCRQLRHLAVRPTAAGDRARQQLDCRD